MRISFCVIAHYDPLRTEYADLVNTAVRNAGHSSSRMVSGLQTTWLSHSWCNEWGEVHYNYVGLQKIQWASDGLITLLILCAVQEHILHPVSRSYGLELEQCNTLTQLAKYCMNDHHMTLKQWIYMWHTLVDLYQEALNLAVSSSLSGCFGFAFTIHWKVVICRPADTLNTKGLLSTCITAGSGSKIAKGQVAQNALSCSCILWATAPSNQTLGYYTQGFWSGSFLSWHCL